MAEKARLFGDEDAVRRILISKSPGEAKSLGRNVIGFKQSVWEEHRSKIVVKGNYLKFNQNEDLASYLARTKNRVLVEASPVDSIWGIGLDSESELATIPVKWRGLNLLGFAHMEVRDMIVEERDFGN